MEDKFAAAKFYDCQDPGILNHTSVEEAIEDMLDTHWEKGEKPEQTLERLAPIEVVAYDPMPKDGSEASAMAERALEDFEERLYEDYGDPDGVHEFWSADERKAIEAKLVAVFQEALGMADVWQCKKVATREFSVADVKALELGWGDDQ